MSLQGVFVLVWPIKEGIHNEVNSSATGIFVMRSHEEVTVEAVACKQLFCIISSKYAFIMYKLSMYVPAYGYFNIWKHNLPLSLGKNK